MISGWDLASDLRELLIWWGRRVEQLLTVMRRSMKCKLDTEVTGNIFTCIVERGRQRGLKTGSIAAYFPHFKWSFYVCLISVLKKDLITLIRKKKDFYDSGMSLETCSFLLFSFPLRFYSSSNRHNSITILKTPT